MEGKWLRTAYLFLFIFFLAIPLSIGQSYEVLFPFDRHNGKDPSSTLVSDSSGNLYGSTRNTMDSQLHCHATQTTDCGRIFQLSPPRQDGTGWQETSIHLFTGSPDGSDPIGDIVIDQFGRIYGTTHTGGANGSFGTVYELSPPSAPGDPWTETVLHAFKVTDGRYPTGITVDSEGNLYGTTSEGGCWLDTGTLFEMSPPAVPGDPWTFETLYRFGCDAHALTEGRFPAAPPIKGPGGDLYGTTLYGGDFNKGTVYKMRHPTAGRTKWRYKTLYSFQGSGDGDVPTARLTAFQQHLYGTTSGLFTGCGTVFQLSPPPSPGLNWTTTTIYEFQCSDGDYSIASVSFDRQGNLYGTTEAGGSGGCFGDLAGCGVVFQLSPPSQPGDPWIDKVLYSFQGVQDGSYPAAGVLIGTSGALYGTSGAGGDVTCRSRYGVRGCGVVFRIVP